jgi:hypothetical protein
MAIPSNSSVPTNQTIGNGMEDHSRNPCSLLRMVQVRECKHDLLGRSDTNQINRHGSTAFIRNPRSLKVSV